MPKASTRTKILLGIVLLSFCAGFLLRRYGRTLMKRWRYNRQKRRLTDQLDRLRRDVDRFEEDLRRLEK